MSSSVGRGHRWCVNCTLELQDGRICSGGEDAEIILWNNALVPEGRLQGHLAPVQCMAELADGTLASCDDAGQVVLWDVGRGVRTGSMQHEGKVRSCVELQDGRLLTGGGDGVLRLWDSRMATCAASLRHHADEVLCMVELADERVAVGGQEASLQLWDLRSMAMAAQVLSQHLVADQPLEDHTQAEPVCCLTQLRDSRLAGGAGVCLWVWDVASLQCVARLEGHAEEVCSILELQDRRLVSGAEDYTVRVWEPATQHCTATLLGHQGAVGCLVELQDSRVVSGSEDYTLRAWELEPYHTPGSTPLGSPTQGVSSLGSPTQGVSSLQGGTGGSAQEGATDGASAGVFLPWQLPHNTQPSVGPGSQSAEQLEAAHWRREALEAAQQLEVAQLEAAQLEAASFASLHDFYVEQHAREHPNSPACPVPHPVAPSIGQHQRIRRPRVVPIIATQSAPGIQSTQSTVQGSQEGSQRAQEGSQGPATGLEWAHEEDVEGDSDSDAPEQYLCAITGRLMQDPVATADGHIYEREAIARWLSIKDTSPMTGLRLPHKELMPIFALRSLIEEHRAKNL